MENLDIGLKDTVRNWWLPLISGTLFVLLGIWAFVAPITSLLALASLFMLSFFVTGLFEIMYALSNKSVLENWGWILGVRNGSNCYTLVLNQYDNESKPSLANQILWR